MSAEIGKKNQWYDVSTEPNSWLIWEECNNFDRDRAMLSIIRDYLEDDTKFTHYFDLPLTKTEDGKVYITRKVIIQDVGDQHLDLLFSVFGTKEGDKQNDDRKRI